MAITQVNGESILYRLMKPGASSRCNECCCWRETSRQMKKNKLLPSSCVLHVHLRICLCTCVLRCVKIFNRSEEHTSELQSLMRISYAVFCLKKKKHKSITNKMTHTNHARL